MNYSLPTALEVCGVMYDIRSDYRAALDIIAALNDPEYDDSDMPRAHRQEAVKAAMWFINGGADEKPGTARSPQLVSWEQDFPHIAPAVNRVLGREIRGPDKLHWWTFLGAYYEIGECLFSQIVGIRDKKARGKKLEKHEQEWYRRNRDIIDIKQKYTQAELEALEALGLK